MPKPKKQKNRKRSQPSLGRIVAYWRLVPLIVLVGLSVLVGQPAVARHTPQRQGVLAYATEMSVGGLLAATNQHRAANGVAALYTNGLLNQAAQAKANDMVARNYWSHNTPEGNPPWIFIDQTGYDYVAAGENLAYGFATSGATVTGWMNSPGHKANMLNATFQEVGFGFANSPNYQNNGPQTVVVAMYAKPAAPFTPPSTPPPAPPPSPPVASQQTKKPVSPAPPAPAAPPPASAPAPTPPAPAPQPPAPQPAAPAANQKQQAPIKETPAKAVTQTQMVTRGRLPGLSFAVSFTGIATALYLAIKHGLTLHKVLVAGEKFILHHPLLDATLVATTILSYLLSQTAGIIK